MNDTVKGLIGEWLSVRSLSVLMFYGATCYLWIHGKEIPPQLAAIDATLMTHFVLGDVMNGKANGIPKP